jgi:hypothetical protein
MHLQEFLKELLVLKLVLVWMLNSTIKHESSKVICYILSYYKSDGTLDNVLHHYEITNAIAVFAVGQTPSKRDASFSSKSNLVEVLENGTMELILV